MPDLLDTTIDDATMGRLHDRLVREAGPMVDIAYRTLDGPVGPLLLAATGEGLVRVGFAADGEDALLEDLADRVSPRILRSSERLESVVRELEEYFAGRRRVFGVRLDLRLARGFRLDVIQSLTRIEYGGTASYAAVADLTGHPKAVRAVGTACALNPLPVVLPCHRVVRSDGSLGQYAGGVEVKRQLLALEQG